LTDATFAIVRTRTQQAEAWRSHIYLDSRGNRTIGWGINLEQGIAPAEGLLLLNYRLTQAETAVAFALPWVATLTEARQAVLLEMAFNLGLAGLLAFRLMLEHLEHGEYPQAGVELLASVADHEEPARAARWAAALTTGVFA
jgi:lysozyme